MSPSNFLSKKIFFFLEKVSKIAFLIIELVVLMKINAILDFLFT